MIERWETRWRNNVQRYADLACMKLILPWSTPSMRFCTSELKVDVICSALRKRWPNSAIVNASGIRRAESSARAKMPVASVMAKLQRKSAQGVAWNPIIDWSHEAVWAAIRASGIEAHEAYGVYGASRVSCSFCIMSTERDLRAAAGCADNAAAYRLLVDLEARSTFAFQGARWLGDVAPELLSDELRARLVRAKAAAAIRQEAEARLPPDLLYVAGWPTRLPSVTEAQRIADIRCRVSDAVGIELRCVSPEAISSRFAELIARKTVTEER
jgi:3'-phosphoadenosine 5'-phosphosulfate sulfotransferase (PAPS reductase)/FAD synthetase